MIEVVAIDSLVFVMTTKCQTERPQRAWNEISAFIYVWSICDVDTSMKCQRYRLLEFYTQRWHRSDNWKLLHSATICKAEHHLIYYILLCCVGQKVNNFLWPNELVFVWKLSVRWNPRLRFLWGSMNLNAKLRKLLNVGNLTWHYWLGINETEYQIEGEPEIKELQIGVLLFYVV
jgi:hypothetical protein